MPYPRGKKWVGQVRKTGQDKEHRREKKFETKTEAKDWEAMMRRKPVEEWDGTTGTASLYDWAEAYLDVAKVRYSEKTYEEKRSMFRRFFEFVAPDLAIGALTPAMVMDYILKQSKERSGYAANKDRKNLVAAWNWGMKYFNPVIPGPNPCLVDRMPEVRTPRYVPPEEDFWRIYHAAEGQDQVMLLAYLHLAARRKELFRLTWEDVDFGNGRVRLWTRKRRDGSQEADWLPMTAELRQGLRWWWEHRPIKESPYVFLCLDQYSIERDHYGQPFKYRIHFMRRLCERAEVKPFGFHGIRHLTASILYNLGYEVAIIKTILRHKSAGTTERYLHTLGLENVRKALEDLTTERGKVYRFTKQDEGKQVEAV